MTLLLATVDALSQAQQASQTMADKNIYTYVIVTLVSALGGLFTAFLLQVRKTNAVQELRITDRDAVQTKLDTLSRDTMDVVKENTQTMFVLTRAVDELLESKHGRVRPKATLPAPKDVNLRESISPSKKVPDD